MVMVVVIVIIIVEPRRIDDGDEEDKTDVVTSGRARLPGRSLLWRSRPQLDRRDTVPKGAALVLEDDQVALERLVREMHLCRYVVCGVEGGDARPAISATYTVIFDPPGAP